MSYDYFGLKIYKIINHEQQRTLGLTRVKSMYIINYVKNLKAVKSYTGIFGYSFALQRCVFRCEVWCCHGSDACVTQYLMNGGFNIWQGSVVFEPR